MVSLRGFVLGGRRRKRMITSYANKTVKEVISLIQKAKIRRQEGLFVAEGVKMFREAPVQKIRKVFVSQRVEKDLLKRCGDKLRQTGYEVVADAVFDKMSDTKTPQGILTVIEQLQYDWKEFLKERPMLLLVEDIQDPGNLGTMFRAGEAAGVSGIILSKDTVDIYNPKTIRSTMGSVYRVPFIYTDDLGEVIRSLRQKQIAVYAAHLEGEKYYDEYVYEGGCAFLIGNEGNGLKEETAKLADSYLKIPMEGKVESLNAAVAASVLLYEAYRQRRKK